MSDTQTDCPDDATLALFAIGELEVRASKGIQDHLKSCDTCCGHVIMIANAITAAQVPQHPGGVSNLRLNMIREGQLPECLDELEKVTRPFKSNSRNSEQAKTDAEDKS